jgi:hypothetical protein
MTTTTYSVLQIALSKQLASDQENLTFVRSHPYSETALSFWENQVKEVEKAIEDTREIFEKSLGYKLIG